MAGERVERKVAMSDGAWAVLMAETWAALTAVHWVAHSAVLMAAQRGGAKAVPRVAW